MLRSPSTKGSGGSTRSGAAANPEARTSQPTATVTAKSNSPATGLPAIGGTPEVSRTLKAYTWEVRDADGMDHATFSYQWISVTGTTETDIPGATSKTYTLVAADQGKTIRVRVSFTDDAGHKETVASEPTSAVGDFEPLMSALSVNPGTLTPGFDSQTSRYTIPDLGSTEGRITLTATLKAGRPVVFVKAAVAIQACPIGPVSCNKWDYQDGQGNKVDPLIDADPNELGFQVDVDAGETKLMIHIHPKYIGEDKAYWLTITRAVNSPATGAPFTGRV